MKLVNIPGCTTKLIPDDKPALSLYGLEGTGKTRLAATAPKPIGLLPLDEKSKRTFIRIGEEMGYDDGWVITPTEPFIPDSSLRTLAMSENTNDVTKTYKDAISRAYDVAGAFVANPDIRTIVMDTCSQFFDWILFSHFGRRTQIKPTTRGAANQDMIDFVNMCRTKNLVLIHRAKEIWKDTGKLDGQGESIQKPSGKFEADGFRNIGGFVTAQLEMTNNTSARDLARKFRAEGAQVPDGL
jgi:hypothetical protein